MTHGWIDLFWFDSLISLRNTVKTSTRMEFRCALNQWPVIGSGSPAVFGYLSRTRLPACRHIDTSGLSLTVSRFSGSNDFPTFFLYSFGFPFFLFSSFLYFVGIWFGFVSWLIHRVLCGTDCALPFVFGRPRHSTDWKAYPVRHHVVSSGLADTESSSFSIFYCFYFLIDLDGHRKIKSL